MDIEKNTIDMSPEVTINQKKEISQIQFVLPQSRQVKTKQLKLNEAR
jgi:hypothetical protein